MAEKSPLQVEIFLPSGTCECSFASWINKVWDVLTEYRDQTDVRTLGSDSLRAKELGIGGRAILVNGEITPLFLLRQKISDLI